MSEGVREGGRERGSEGARQRGSFVRSSSHLVVCAQVYSQPAPSTEPVAKTADGTVTDDGPYLNVAVNFWFRNETSPPPFYH